MFTPGSRENFAKPGGTMNKSILCSTIATSLFLTAAAHVEEINSGVFLSYQNLKQGRGISKKSPPYAFFEKKEDGGDAKLDSIVFDIRNDAQFQRLVLKNSTLKPVALKIYKSSDKNNTEADNHVKMFQDVAEVFSSNMIFAGLDLSRNKGNFYEMLNLKDEDLPLIIFFENGQPQTPFVPANQHKNYLINLIEGRFFRK